MRYQSLIQILVFFMTKGSSATESEVRFIQNVTLSNRISVGADVRFTQEASRLACAQKCALETHCNAFFYGPSSGQCARLPDATPASTVQSDQATRFFQRVKNDQQEAAIADSCLAVDGFTFLPELDNFCFKLMLDVVSTWDLAISGCQALGLELALLYPDDKMVAVINTILSDDAYTTPLGIDYYIGASMPRSQWDVSTARPYTNWFWTDGTPVSTAHWGSGQPGGLGEDHVLALYSPAYLVYDRPSTCSYRYVCQKNVTATPLS